MKIRYIASFTILLLIVVSCKKENTRYSYQDGIEGAQNFVVAQQMMTQLLNTYFKSLTDSVLLADKQAKIDGADVYYYDEPERILIKYPWWGNYDGYGHWRMNYYEAIPRTSFSDDGVEVDIVFTNFLFDKDTLITKNIVVQHQGKTDGVNDHFAVSADRIDLIYADTTGTLSFSFDQLNIRYKDPATYYTSSEDKFSVSGNLDGTTRSLLNFQSTIQADSVLLNSFNCIYLREGNVTVGIESFEYPTSVYFPNQDTCRNEYLIVINNNPFPYPINEDPLVE